MSHQAAMTRRRFAQILGAGAAYIAAKPHLAFAESSPELKTIAPAVVRLSSNENAYGPSALALKAITGAFGVAGRYPDDYADRLIDTVARDHRVTADEVLLGNGSGEILKLCAAAFTGPSSSDCDREIKLARPARGMPLSFKGGRGRLVVADPTFEAILNHCAVSGAEVVRVPLTASFAHDLPKMRAAAREGLIYICNPNNPTASLTPKDDLRNFIATCPRDTMILVDEAYHHYVDSPDYESLIPFIKQHPNLIVARTFSKIYGMAGLRCGYCVAHAEAIQRMRPHQTWDSVNVMAAVAANASLNDPQHVADGRRRNAATRSFLTRELQKLGYKHIPSQANFVMVDVKRPVQPLIGALRERRVHVGRLFPTLPNHMRVTIGKRAEMETFLSAFRLVVR